MMRTCRGAPRHSSHETTLVAMYVLGGGLLAAVVGGVAAPRRELPAAARYSDTLVIETDHPRAEDDDSVIIWPLLGLSAGAVLGAGASQIHHAVSRMHRRNTNLA